MSTHLLTGLRARSWRAEGLLRMLENVLDVGQAPAELVVYASLAKAARDHESFRRIQAELLSLDVDQTLVLQSGRPVGVVVTGEQAPLVVSAVNNMVGRWQTPERFYEMAADGATIWGGLTAAAWQYIGRQGVLQGTYEVLRLALASRQPAARGAWLLTAGLGGMGSAQPISARMLGLSSLTVEVDMAAIARSQAQRGVDMIAGSLEEALGMIRRATVAGTPLAVGLGGNAATVFAEVSRLAAAGLGPVPDLVTDQTAAHDLRHGYLPEGLAHADWEQARRHDPVSLEAAARVSIGREVRAILDLARLGSTAFENGNNLRVHGADAGIADAFDIPGFMPAYLRPLFCRGIGPFRWVALSGDPADIDVLDTLAVELFGARPEVARWIALAREHIPPQGLPARSCWLGHGERSAIALAANAAVADGRLRAPVLFTRDHLDAAAMTHPRIGTEAMADGSDGVSDWPLLDAMLLAATGADLVAVHAGGGGYSGWMQSAGVSIVADGDPTTAIRLRRTLDADTALGVLRYAEAGYDAAAAAVTRHDLHWSNDPEVTNA